MSGKIGFYSLETTLDGKGYLGALLVTDDLGKPEEFRVTYPVKPTLLQRQLYGESLVPYVGVELCGKPLYKTATNKLELLMVSSMIFLPVSQAADCRVACLERMGDTMKLSDEAGGPPAHHGTLRSHSGRFQPLAVTYPLDYTDDERAEAYGLLERFFSSVDLMEPFDRIKVATEALAGQDPDFT